MVVTKEDTEEMVKTIIAVHEDIISETGSPLHDQIKELPKGGQSGVRDAGGLHTLAYEMISFQSKVPERPSIELATILLYDITTKHYFWDGNKRTAFVIAGTFLRTKGIALEPDYQNAVDFLIKVAQGNANKPEIKKWLLEHSKSIGDGQ